MLLFSFLKFDDPTFTNSSVDIVSKYDNEEIDDVEIILL